MKLHWTGLLLSFGIAASAAVVRREVTNSTDYPKNFAVALYNSFDAIDVFGPIDVLFYLSFMKQLNLSLIAETPNPTWIRPATAAHNKMNSSFAAAVIPTHTYANPPQDVEVLIVPGGQGQKFGNGSALASEYIRKTFPKLKYLMTICTGVGVAVQAGVLDGKRATTNKAAWSEVIKLSSEVKWVSPARYTVDGKIWTSSGVTSGFDLMFHFIDTVFDKESSRYIQGLLEHDRKGACDDPFAAWHNVPPSGDCRDSP